MGYYCTCSMEVVTYGIHVQWRSLGMRYICIICRWIKIQWTGHKERWIQGKYLFYIDMMQ